MGGKQGSDTSVCSPFPLIQQIWGRTDSTNLWKPAPLLAFSSHLHSWISSEHMIKERHDQVSKDFSFRIYRMHKLALADKFQTIKYMNQCPDLSSRFGWKQGQVHPVMKRQKLPILWASESRDVLPKEMQSDYAWVLAWKATSVLEKAQWKFCVPKITPMTLVAVPVVP